MEETYREESVWGKEDYAEKTNEKEELDVGNRSEQVTAVETPTMNPLASLVQKKRKNASIRGLHIHVGFIETSFCVHFFHGNWVCIWWHVCN
jgi:hypothetical protein